MADLSIQPNESIRLRELHRDAWVIVVDKPAGLVSQPGRGHENDTVLSALFATDGAALQRLGRARDFGLLHRLDRWASGVLIVAREAGAYDALRDDFAARRIEKYYWAVCGRAPSRPTGLVRRPIAERQGEMKTAVISPRGKEAVTAYRTLSASAAGALLECRPLTGRLHQVRLHLASIRCAIAGDELYAPERVRSLSRHMALHAHRVVFKHPATGATIDVRSPMPRRIATLARRLRLDPQAARGLADEGRDHVENDTVGDEEPGV